MGANSVDFGDILGYRTNTRDVIAFATSNSWGVTGATLVDVITLGQAAHDGTKLAGVVLNNGNGTTAAVGEVWVTPSS